MEEIKVTGCDQNLQSATNTFYVVRGLPKRQFGQKGSKSVLNAMATSKHGYEEVATKEGGS